MKANSLTWTLLVLIAGAVQLSAQQSEKDRELFEAAKPQAENGDVIAQFVLGTLYSHGRGVAQDYSEAAKWFRKAAEQGNADAEYALGICYYKGEGVETNDTEAVKWYRKAADQNYAKAQYILGFCYADGDGVEKDYVKAAMWWRKAAEQGDCFSPKRPWSLLYQRRWRD